METMVQVAVLPGVGLKGLVVDILLHFEALYDEASFES